MEVLTVYKSSNRPRMEAGRRFNILFYLRSNFRSTSGLTLRTIARVLQTLEPPRMRWRTARRSRAGQRRERSSRRHPASVADVGATHNQRRHATRMALQTRSKPIARLCAQVADKPIRHLEIHSCSHHGTMPVSLQNDCGCCSPMSHLMCATKPYW